MKKQPIHPTDYDRELDILIHEGLSPRQAALCLKYLRRDKRAPLRFKDQRADAGYQFQLPLKP